MSQSEPPDPWFSTKGKCSDEEPATRSEVRALEDFMIGIAPAPEAAKRLLSTDEDEKPLDDKLNRVAWLIFDAAIHFQSQQPEIIELVEAINHLSPDDLGFTAAQKQRFPTWRAWRELDEFEVLLDDMRRSYSAYRYTPDEEDENPQQCCHRWASINAFLAQRYVRSPAESSSALMYGGLPIIRDALEQQPWEDCREKRSPSEANTPKSDITILNADLAAAAQWMLVAGPDIYQLVESGRVLDPQLTVSDLWRDSEPGLSKGRWELWKTRLLWVQQQDALDRETLDCARQTLLRMEEIEKGYS